MATAFTYINANKIFQLCMPLTFSLDCDKKRKEKKEMKLCTYCNTCCKWSLIECLLKQSQASCRMRITQFK